MIAAVAVIVVLYGRRRNGSTGWVGPRVEYLGINYTLRTDVLEVK